MSRHNRNVPYHDTVLVLRSKGVDILFACEQIRAVASLCTWLEEADKFSVSVSH